VNKTFLKKI